MSSKDKPGGSRGEASENTENADSVEKRVDRLREKPAAYPGLGDVPITSPGRVTREPIGNLGRYPARLGSGAPITPLGSVTREIPMTLGVPTSQNVIDETGKKRKVVRPESDTEGSEAPRRPTVRVRHGSRQAVFYSLTDAEIEHHAQLGFLSSVALTLFGVAAGFMLGCLVALIQGDLSETSTTAFWYLLIVTAVVALIFLVASIYLWRLKKRNSQVWKSPSEDQE